MKITFNGASGMVTGSCYLVESGDLKFLVDCGMFQGIEDEHRNANFNFDPKKLDFVLLTHSHIDHSGLIPKLYKEGFRGKIYATTPTIEITSLLFKDSAKIQEDNYARHIISAEEMLFDTTHALQAISNFESVSFGQINKIKDVSFKYVRAGHVLGAASIIIYLEDKSIIFSGDIGREEQTLIRPYELIDEDVDFVVMESLYGGFDHPGREESVKKLHESVEKIVGRNGNVTIPSFALHRSQEMILNFRYLLESGLLTNNVHIFLDGPLAESITKIYSQYENTEVFPDLGYFSMNFAREDNFFSYDNFRIVDDYKDSLRLMRKSHRVILAGSGMCTGGRIMNHLTRGLKKEKNGIIFVGYQAEGTLGRQIVQGAKEVSVNNKMVKVRAEVIDLKGFSAHAGNSDLLKWIENKKSDRLKKVFLTHADPERSLNFKEQILDGDYDVEIPNINQSFII